MMNSTTRNLTVAIVLGLSVIALGAQAQTASPGPSSRNANVDKEDPNKPDTPAHEIPNHEAPRSVNNDNYTGAAGTSTPTGGDASTTTKNMGVTQPINRNPAALREKESDSTG